MGTQLAPIEPIPLPDVRRPAKLSMLPQWVEQRCAICKRARQPDSQGIWREVSTLPKSLVLAKEQKLVIERHISALEVALSMTPIDDIGHAELTMTTVTKMTLVLPSRETGDLAGEARGEAFMAALDDIPSWAVQEAMRKWHRGEYGPKYDYKWQPVPCTLRELAMAEVWLVRGTVRKLNDILLAEPLFEMSPEQEAAMKAKVSAYLSMRAS